MEAAYIVILILTDLIERHSIVSVVSRLSSIGVSVKFYRGVPEVLSVGP